MPGFQKRVPPYKPTRTVTIDWPTFNGGLDTLLQDNEIKGNELSQAENIMLTGRGVPTKRWGSQLYHQSGNATGSVRSLHGFYKSNSTIELLALTDDGFLTKKSGASYSTLTGVSWASGPSGLQAYMTQLDDSMYIVHPNRELVKYSNPTLVGFPTIAVPVITGATNLSNATGTTTKAYVMTAVSNVGETAQSTEFTLANQPDSLGGDAGGTLRLIWTGVSTASGILQGFNIYGRSSGNERFLAGVPATTTFWNDDGTVVAKDFSLPPSADSTGGPKAKYVARFQDRLIFAGIEGEPTKVLISGRVPNHEKFDLANGGNYIDIEPDAGDNIVQILTFTDRIIVFKEKSIWQITLSFEQFGNFWITNPELKLITAAIGCIAPGSVVSVDNDAYFLSRNGVRTIGYDKNFAFDTLRTSEISVKIRPYFDSVTYLQKQNATAFYAKNKYGIAFPGKDQMMVFDRERGAWTGPWTLDATVFELFFDENGDEHLLFAQEGSTNVDEFSDTFPGDNGTAIQTIVRTRNEDFGNWSIFKNIKNVFTQLRSVTGSVDVDITIETRTGGEVTAKDFTVTATAGNSGWGADQWGTALWGSTNGTISGGETNFTIRWANLNKTGRLMSMTFRTTDLNANYELLSVRAEAKPLGSGARPTSWRV